MIGISGSLAIIDEMWHTFLLFSIDYKQFCETYFKGFIDHKPGPTSLDKPKFKIFESSTTFEEQWKLQQDITRKALGPTVAKRWYHDYKKFTKIKIKKMQLKALVKDLS